MLSQKKINEIFESHRSVFKALEEFERTGRVIVKTRMNFTIDRELASKFREYCRQRRLNMSREIEQMMGQRVTKKS